MTSSAPLRCLANIDDHFDRNVLAAVTPRVSTTRRFRKPRNYKSNSLKFILFYDNLPVVDDRRSLRGRLLVASCWELCTGFAVACVFGSVVSPEICGVVVLREPLGPAVRRLPPRRRGRLVDFWVSVGPSVTADVFSATVVTSAGESVSADCSLDAGSVWFPTHVLHKHGA